MKIWKEKNLELVHYSNSVVEKVVSVEQQEGMKNFKPRGFWFSVEDGDGWREWCEAEAFRLDCLAFEHEVELHSDAHILHLSSGEDIDKFSKEFGFGGVSDFMNYMLLTWDRVAAQYQGLIIAPYQWEKRLDPDCGWYYGWDCSSGCIWDANAIASVKVRVNQAA